MRISWTRKALENLEEHAEYIAEADPLAAARVVDKIFCAIDMLADHPGVGRPGRVPGTRELVVTGTPYIVPYRVREQAVEILRVFHGSRRWPSSL